MRLPNYCIADGEISYKTMSKVRQTEIQKHIKRYKLRECFIAKNLEDGTERLCGVTTVNKFKSKGWFIRRIVA